MPSEAITSHEPKRGGSPAYFQETSAGPSYHASSPTRVQWMKAWTRSTSAGTKQRPIW